VITEEKVLETLERFDISEDDLEAWEAELGLDIPVDAYGEKQYSPLHINLFKNVRKHLTLGRSLAEIKRMIVLPASSDNPNANEPIDIQATPSQPRQTSETAEIHRSASQQAEIQQALKPQLNLSQRLMAQLKPALAEKQARDRFMGLQTQESDDVIDITANQVEAQSVPVATGDSVVESSAEAVAAFESPFEPTLAQETETEIVFSATDVDLPAPPLTVVSLSKRPASQGNLKRFASPSPKLASSSIAGQSGANAGLLALVDKLMSEKDALQGDITQLERKNAHLREANTMMQARVRELVEEAEATYKKVTSEEHLKLIQDKSQLQKQAIEAEQRAIEAEKAIETLNQTLAEMTLKIADAVDPRKFTGNWLEEATLMAIEFDNFGINIEDKRNRLFRITHAPTQCFGHTAVIETLYDYQTNALWKRKETLILDLISESQLQGHLTIEYILDGTPVARAGYALTCTRKA